MIVIIKNLILSTTGGLNCLSLIHNFCFFYGYNLSIWIDALSMVWPQQFSIGVFVIILVMHVGSNVLNCTNYIVSSCTGSGNRGAMGHLTFKVSPQECNFSNRKSLQFSKVPHPLTFSSFLHLWVSSFICKYHPYVTECNIPHYIYINDKHIVKDCYFRK